MVEKVIHNFLDFLFPQKCLGCGQENETICKECFGKIDFPSLIKSGSVYSASDYNDRTVKRAIWRLKYRNARCFAEPLAELINTRCLQNIVRHRVFNKSDWIIVPIPLSEKRLKERGFNQSELIAQHLAEKLKKPKSDIGTDVRLRFDMLYKIKETPSQVSVKNRRDRLENIKGSFAVKNSGEVQNKNIILIDDVTTTGATLKEASKVLRASGAKKVISLVVARG